MHDGALPSARGAGRPRTFCISCTGGFNLAQAELESAAADAQSQALCAQQQRLEQAAAETQESALAAQKVSLGAMTSLMMQERTEQLELAANEVRARRS